MSITTSAPSFDRTVTDLKQGVAYATAAQAEASEKAVKAAKELAALSKGAFEAFTQAGQIFTTGAQDLFRQIAESNQAAMTEALSGFRALTAAKTAKERLELQASLAQTAATRAVSEGSRFAQAGIELATKAAAPLTARAALAVESLSAFKI